MARGIGRLHANHASFLIRANGNGMGRHSAMLCFAIVLFVLCCPIARKTEPEQKISDGYIFRVKDGYSLCLDSQSIRSRAQEGHHEIKAVECAEGLYSADSLEAINKVLPSGALEYVETNRSLTPMDAGEAASKPNDPYYDELWGLEAINMASAWNAGLDGKGVVAAVIDTGISPDHEDLDYNFILKGRNFSGSGDDADVTDEEGHGTFVAGVLAAKLNNGLGVAGATDQVSILPVKCMTSDTGAKVAAVVSAINYAVEAHCDIIVLSIGTADKSRALEEAVGRALDSGVVLFSAVGNVGTSTLYYPAAYDGVIGVGSVDRDMKASSLSQRNDSVFVVAPGQDIMGLWVNSGKISHRHGSSGLYALRTGTSYATSYAAALGVIAKSLYPNIIGAEVKRLLMETSTDLGSKGYDTAYGFGLINAKPFISSLMKMKR